VLSVPQKTQTEKRRLIDDTIGQLLALLSQQAAYALLIEKVQELHGHVQSLFSKPGSNA